MVHGSRFTMMDEFLWCAAEDWYLFTVVWYPTFNMTLHIHCEWILLSQRNVVTLPFNSPDPDWSRSREAEVDCPER